MGTSGFVTDRAVVARSSSAACFHPSMAAATAAAAAKAAWSHVGPDPLDVGDALLPVAAGAGVRPAGGKGTPCRPHRVLPLVVHHHRERLVGEAGGPSGVTVTVHPAPSSIAPLLGTYQPTASTPPPAPVAIERALASSLHSPTTASMPVSSCAGSRARATRTKWSCSG